MNVLAYASCIHQFRINENGFIQIDIYGYDGKMEKFINVIEKPLIPSMTMKFNKCSIVGSCLTDKEQLVLLHLMTLNGSILMLIQLQSRPWLCQIVYTLSIQSSMKCLSINSFLSVFINEEKSQHGFYIVDNARDNLKRTFEFISCSLFTYLYCHLQDHAYWLMGTDFDVNTEQKIIKVYYGCSLNLSNSLVSFHTTKFIPISLVDNIEDIYVINHRIQLKSRLILGDVIISTRDNRVLSCHNGAVCHQLSINNLVTSILSYRTIGNEQLFLFMKKDIQSVDIFKYGEDFQLAQYTDASETTNYILIDDFSQIGWKQLLFIKNNLNLNSFTLFDFSQIHVCHHDSNYEYDPNEKSLCTEMDDVDVRASLAIAQDLLRKKIINADFLVNEGYFQCRQIENDIRKISLKDDIIDLCLSKQFDSFASNSNMSTVHLQLIDMNWFVHRMHLFLHVTIKNTANIDLTSVYVFGIDKNNHKMKSFNLKTNFQSSLNEHMSFSLNADSCRTFILTTFIELDKDIDIELYLLTDDDRRIYRVGSVNVRIDDLINPNNRHVLQLNALETESMNNLNYRQALLYISTLFRLEMNIQATTKFYLIEHLRQLLSTMGFNRAMSLPNTYLRINSGNIFEHIIVHLVNEDDFITDDLTVHIYAQSSADAMAFGKHILSKLDFHSFSLIHARSSLAQQQNIKVFNRMKIELSSYLDVLKDIPTIMRKMAPTSKSESFRLLKLENFQSFQNDCHLTDLLLTSLVID